MILLFSVVGIFVLFALKYFIDKKDNANIKVKEFIVSKKFLEAVTELIVIILGATIAINFTNIQEKKENKQRTIALLEATKSEIEESYNLNSAFISKYDEGNFTIGELKYNASCNLSTLNKVLDNDMVIVTITPISYQVLCNNMDNANIFNDMRNNADNEDGNIYTYVKGINSHLETILYEIDNEILYLKGKYTEKNVQNKYYEHIETKCISIDTENN